eukprot:4603443-Pyramimonas_sp.AAC.1
MVSTDGGYVLVAAPGTAPNPASSWCVKPSVVDGISSVQCDKGDARFKRFLSQKLGMVDALSRARNNMVDELM